MFLTEFIVPFLTVLVLLAIIFFNFKSKEKNFLFFIGFALPLTSLSLNTGINIFWYSIVGPLSLVLLLAKGKRFSLKNYDRNIYRFIVYICLITTSWMVLEYVVLHRYEIAQSVGLGPGQALFKMPVQLFSFVFQVLAFYIIPSRAKQKQDIYAAFSGYIYGNIFSLICAFIMSFTLGIGYIRSNLSLESRTYLIDDMQRFGGLSGEPKHFGAFLVIFLSLNLALYAFEKRKYPKYTLFIVIGLIGLFFTYSTSAWIGFGFAFGSYIFLLIKKIHRARARLVLFLVPIGIYLVATSTLITLVFEDRLTERLFSKDSYHVSQREGQKDNLVFDVYKDHPYVALFGYGLGGMDLASQPYYYNSPKYRMHMLFSRTPTPSTNGIRIFGDLGIFGLFFLSHISWIWYKYLLKRNEYAMGTFVFISFVGLMFISINAVTAFFFISGGAVTLAKLKTID